LINDQIIRVISSPSNSTIGFATLIFAIMFIYKCCFLPHFIELLQM
jgi:hypothetical protein